MAYLLNLIYLVVLAAFLPVLVFQRWFRGKKRPGFWTKFTGRVSPRKKNSRPCVWIHAVSLGEIHLIRSLVERLESELAEMDIVISTSTATGLKAARKHFGSHQVILFPFDFTWAIRSVIARIRPSMGVLAELEIWPNLLAECPRQSIVTSLVNGRLSQASLEKYKRWRFVFSHVFRSLDLVCVRNERVQQRFLELGVPAPKLVVTGNLKFDQLIVDKEVLPIQRLRVLADVRESQTVFLAGSTQAPEEELAIGAYKELSGRFPSLRLFLCPRHPERFDEVAALLIENQLPFQRRSELPLESHAGSAESPESTERVWLIDSVGELKYWWGVSDIALVGGSFGDRGGQNMLEPAALGAAVCFGPHTQNYAEEVESLLSENAAVQLREGWELTDFVRRCCDSKELRETLGDQSRKVVQRQLLEPNSATDQTVGALVKTIVSSPKCEKKSTAA
ncbi:MAG: glycosyltransferase N-terminal domain-containing protein [Pirellulaceae bacterium]|nr:glycosyltransferase N-terminal domain-containing protein [Pirellulaceae bacterium]